MAHGDRPRRSWAAGVRRRDGRPHLFGSPPWLRACRPESVLRDPEEQRQEHDAAYEPPSRRDGAIDGRGRGNHLSSVRDLRGALAGSCPAPRSGRGDGQPRSTPAKEGKGAHRREGLRAHLSASVLSGPQPDRRSPLEDQALPKEDRRSHQGGSHRSDGPSIGSREHRRRARVLHPLWLPHPGAAAMKGAVRRVLRHKYLNNRKRWDIWQTLLMTRPCYKEGAGPPP